MLLLPGTVWLLLLFVVPIGVLVVVSFATVDDIGRPVLGWHPEAYESVLDPVYLRILGRSLFFATATTVLCFAIGYPLAYTIARFGGRYRTALIALVIVPWLVDYLVRIYAWVAILGNEGVVNGLLSWLGFHGSPPLQITNTAYAVIIGLVYSYLPLMVMPLYSRLERMDQSLIEAGKDLYASAGTTFLRVTLPYSAPSIVAGCLLVFLPCAGDFATAGLLGGPGNYTMGNLIADQFQQAGDWPLGAVFTVMLMAFMWTVIALYFVRSRSKPGFGLGVE